MLAQVSWTEDVYCTVACDFVITVDFFVNVLMMSEKSVLVVSIAWWQLRRSKSYVANNTCGLQCKTLPLYSLSYCDLYVFLYSIASCGSVLIRVTKGLTLTVLWSPVILLMFQWWKHLFFIFCIIRHCRKKKSLLSYNHKQSSSTGCLSNVTATTHPCSQSKTCCYRNQVLTNYAKTTINSLISHRKLAAGSQTSLTPLWKRQNCFLITSPFLFSEEASWEQLLKTSMAVA